MKQDKTNKNENFTPTLFADIFDNAKFFGKNWLEKEFGQSLPAVNIKETNKDFNLEFAAPGFKKNDFKVSVDHNVLNICAEKEEEKKEENKRFTRKEFSYNSFSRSFTLPESVNAEKIDAKYEEGILKLSVPKLVETKSLPKKEIKVA
ncbi:MAG TPA: Hsp20/alpha crystallin family protein [Bacteroidia bacterium]|jgi:HSP20 family protein|nr:Hsp20/alpha crystallin family protein [Bacteroidia bacterium]